MESQFAEQLEGRSSLCKGLYQTKDETMVTKKVQLGQGVNATKCDPTFVCVCVQNQWHTSRRCFDAGLSQASNARVSLSTHRQTCRSLSMLEAWDLLAGRSIKYPEPETKEAIVFTNVSRLSPCLSEVHTRQIHSAAAHGCTTEWLHAWVWSCGSCERNLLSFFYRSPLICLPQVLCCPNDKNGTEAGQKRWKLNWEAERPNEAQS